MRNRYSSLHPELLESIPKLQSKAIEFSKNGNDPHHEELRDLITDAVMYVCDLRKEEAKKLATRVERDALYLLGDKDNVGHIDPSHNFYPRLVDGYCELIQKCLYYKACDIGFERMVIDPIDDGKRLNRKKPVERRPIIIRNVDPRQVWLSFLEELESRESAQSNEQGIHKGGYVRDTSTSAAVAY